jgi:hypothetical protein
MKARISWGIAGALIALAVSLVVFGGTPGATAGTAGTDGDLVLSSYISNGSCTVGTTNCAGGATGVTSKFGGLFWRADDGTGMTGSSLSGDTGVRGSSQGTGGAGIGVSGEGPSLGVEGKSTSGTGVSGTGGNGVYGEGTENGVQAKGGTFGVFAEGEDYGTYSRGPNYGVFGNATGASGTGVWGESSSGTGVRAKSATGTALHVTGKAKFSRSGIVTVAAGISSKTVTLAGVTTSSMVLATAQQFKTVHVKAAVPGSGAFTIRLTGNAPTGGLKVAYFVLN